jgi:hypothetical protein
MYLVSWYKLLCCKCFSYFMLVVPLSSSETIPPGFSSPAEAPESATPSSGITFFVRNLKLDAAHLFAKPMPGCMMVRQALAISTMTPSNTMNCTSLLARWPENPALSSTERKTVRTKRQAVAMASASSVVRPCQGILISSIIKGKSSRAEEKKSVLTDEEYLETLGAVQILVLSVPLTGASTNSEHELDSTRRE